MGYTPDLVTGCWVGGEEPSIHFRNINLGRGGYTALPIVGKFFNKLYRDPAFNDYKFHTFRVFLKKRLLCSTSSL